jgi:outer membrane lipoprotein-sorting protein
MTVMKNKILTIIGFILSISVVYAQDVDEIINNYFENTGGAGNWEKMQTLQVKAVMNQGEMQLNMKMIQKRGDKLRAEIQVQGKTIIQAYDGETGWFINPLMGSEAPQKMPPEMLEEMQQEKFESELLNYQDKGHSVALEGKEDIEGTETFKLKLTKKNGDIEYYFFDTEYYVPIMQRAFVKSGPAKGQETETYISDYQEVGEFMMPFFIDTRMNGQSVMKMTIEGYTLNEEIDDSIFAMPGE